MARSIKKGPFIEKSLYQKFYRLLEVRRGLLLKLTPDLQQ